MHEASHAAGHSCVVKMAPGATMKMTAILMAALAFAAPAIANPLDADDVFGPLDDAEVLDYEYHNDGTWSYLLASDSTIDTDTVIKDRAILWRYAGQHRYGFDGSGFSGTVSYQVEAEPQKEELLEDRLEQMVIIDNRGRKWEFESYDTTEFQANVDAYDEAFPESSTGDADCSESASPLEVDVDQPDVGDWVDLELHSWTKDRCTTLPDPDGNTSTYGTHMWEGEDRIAVAPADFTWQEMASVQIKTTSGDGVVSRCSGTLIDKTHILTAAHCVATIHSYKQPNDQVEVTLSFMGTPSRVLVENIHIGEGYTKYATTSVIKDWKDDWAIIRLEKALYRPAVAKLKDHLTHNHFLRLSKASDSVLEGLCKVRTFGYPSFVEDCIDSSDTFRSLTETEPIKKLSKSKLYHKADSAPGQSGAPYYYCPHEDDSRCDENTAESGYVYSVHAGWSTSPRQSEGPRVKRFRSEAINFIDAVDE